MSTRRLLSVFLLALFSSGAAAQVLSFPDQLNRFGNRVDVDPIVVAQMDFNFLTINGMNADGTPLQSPSGSVSMLDLKAPGKAQREYQKGYQLLMRKDTGGAIQHLENATEIYSKYVAAHNALGTAYLNLNQNEKARNEFSTAVELDDHMPNSFLNLGCAQLALQQYTEAEGSFRKASTLAPLDMQVQLALAYAEYENKNYDGVVATANDVHAHKHQGAALVHFFAAGAFKTQNNLQAAQDQMKLLLREDPKSPSTDEYRKILGDLKTEAQWREAAHFNPIQKVSYSIGVPAGPSPEIAGRMAQLAFQEMEEKDQISEAELQPDPVCRECGAVAENTASESGVPRKFKGTLIRSSVDEVSILFAATDHGKSVTDLASSDIELRDNSQPPNAILNFRNESQLPLRLGLVIDTSDSVTERFKFEQGAAIRFLQKVMNSPNDLAFVVAVNNSVRLVQDFTADQEATAHSVDQLAPAGGTALWDAVTFASEKLASRTETQPVARILVVISDGEDNSSVSSLKEALSAALRSEVAVYSVSTKDELDQQDSALLGPVSYTH